MNCFKLAVELGRSGLPIRDYDNPDGLVIEILDMEDNVISDIEINEVSATYRLLAHSSMSSGFNVDEDYAHVVSILKAHFNFIHGLRHFREALSEIGDMVRSAV
jgi:hypothetical protein